MKDEKSKKLALVQELRQMEQQKIEIRSEEDLLERTMKDIIKASMSETAKGYKFADSGDSRSGAVGNADECDSGMFFFMQQT